MYYVVLCLCWAAVALAAPAPPDVLPLEKQQPTVIPIVSQSDELEANGTYKFSYETGNGIKREETAYEKVIPKARGKSAPSDSNEGGESDGDSDEIHVQQGSYSYTAPDGTLISVRYIADENGFQPIGDHIPRVPSVSGGSGEKSGRALDNSEAASAPVVAARSALKPEEKPTAAKTASPPAAPEPKKPVESAEQESSSTAAESESSTKPADAEASTTEAASKESTTEGARKEASTTEVTSEASTTEAEKASETTEASTPAAVTTTGESSTTPAAEPSTTVNDGSTTEATASTTPAA